MAEVTHAKDGQLLVQGTVTALQDTVTMTRMLTWGVLGVQITGTWTGTITFECNVDQATWVTVSVTPSNSTITAVNTTANGVWSIPNNAFAQVRCRFSTATSGSAVVTSKSLPSQF